MFERKWLVPFKRFEMHICFYQSTISVPTRTLRTERDCNLRSRTNPGEEMRISVLRTLPMDAACSLGPWKNNHVTVGLIAMRSLQYPWRPMLLINTNIYSNFYSYSLNFHSPYQLGGSSAVDSYGKHIPLLLTQLQSKFRNTCWLSYRFLVYDKEVQTPGSSLKFSSIFTSIWMIVILYGHIKLWPPKKKKEKWQKELGKLNQTLILDRLKEGCYTFTQICWVGIQSHEMNGTKEGRVYRHMKWETTTTVRI